MSTNIRTLMTINLGSRIFYYSDEDGLSYLKNTGGVQFIGPMFQSDSEQRQFEGRILSTGKITEIANIDKLEQSLSSVSIRITNQDQLQFSLRDYGQELEGAEIHLWYVEDNQQNNILAEFFGRADNVSWSKNVLSFSLKSHEIVRFQSVPPTVFTEDTFQTKKILDVTGMEISNFLDMRFADNTAGSDWGGQTAVQQQFVKKIHSSNLVGYEKDYWKGSRVDIVDATDDMGDPKSSAFCIGEFAVVVASESDWVQFSTVLDRYAIYRNMDERIRDPALGDPDAPYSMYTVLNNTMRNVVNGAMSELINGGFDDDSGWGLNTGWSISGGVATVSPSAAGAMGQVINSIQSNYYRVKFEVTSYTAGTVTVQIGVTGSSTNKVVVDAAGVYEKDLYAEGLFYDTLLFGPDAAADMSFDNVEIRPLAGKATFMIKKNPVPENADSQGKPVPIVYGHVEKMPLVWAIGTKSTKQNSMGTGNDLYLMCSHDIVSSNATEIEVYYGLDENAAGMKVPPGVIDFVPTPLPKSVYEIDRWTETGYSLVDPIDSDRNICPLHRLVKITGKKNNLYMGVRLRGDEYNGWTENEYTAATGNSIDGTLPGINGEPQFPIRYGLGNSKLFASFDGYKDLTGKYTGVPGGLIEHPTDIIAHFVENYSNMIEQDIELGIDQEALARSRARLLNWKFSTVIKDKIEGVSLIQRLTSQCKSLWTMKNGVFFLKTIDLDDNSPDLILNKEMFLGELNWNKKPISKFYNDFTLRYGFDYSIDKYSQVVLRNKSNSQDCRDSWSRYGQVTRSLPEVNLPDIIDPYTANQFADHLVSYHARDHISLTSKVELNEITKQLSTGQTVYISGLEEAQSFIVIETSFKKSRVMDVKLMSI